MGAVVALLVPASVPLASAQPAPAARAAVTFAKDVAPVLQKNCQECHRSGDVGPMSLDQVVAQFTDRNYRMVDEDDWIRMALRHSIFEQGGPALGVMTVSDRNGSGHFQHLGGGRGILPGMK